MVKDAGLGIHHSLFTIFACSFAGEIFFAGVQISVPPGARAMVL
jgi:hypothetical protein